MAEEINNKEFFEELIQNHYNDPTIKIIDFELKSGIGKGENYSSVILRAQVHWQRSNLETGEENLVIKTLPQGEASLEMSTKNKVFITENLYYTEILSMYKSILSSRGIEIHTKLAPAYLKCKNPNVVVLEDLAPLGFRMGDRHNGEDFNHGLLLVKALARNQALSIAVNRKIPGYFDDKVSKAFEHNEKLYDTFFSKPLKEHIDLLEQWPEFQEYVGRIQPKSGKEINDIMISGELRAISQGDCWINNMLFRYDNATDAPVEICLIDFQYYFWGSIAYDVIYFMHSSLSPDVLVNKKHILIDEYIKEFHKWMKDLGEELGEYSRENILKEFENMKYLAVIIVMTFLYMMCSDPEDTIDFDHFEDEDGLLLRDKIRNKPEYKQKLLKHFRIFNKENVI